MYFKIVYNILGNIIKVFVFCKKVTAFSDKISYTVIHRGHFFLCVLVFKLNTLSKGSVISIYMPEGGRL